MNTRHTPALQSKAWSEITGRVALDLSPANQSLLETLRCPNGWIFSLWTSLHLSVWLLLVLWAKSSDGILLGLALSPLIGSQLHALTILQHDCGHGSAYRSASANLWVGRFLAWFIFMPFTTFTYLHKRHHAFLGQPDRDPDEWFYAGGVRRLFLRECLFLPRFVYESLGRRLPEKIRRQVWRELAFNTVTWLAAIGASVHCGAFGWFLATFLLPTAWLALVINPISRGYEHFPMAELGRERPERLNLSHNTITVTSRVFGLLWANITYHVEHHLYPTVPFYRLPCLYALLRGKDYPREPYPLFRLLHGTAPEAPAQGDAQSAEAG
jgi:beta-carotene hydroxylase